MSAGLKEEATSYMKKAESLSKNRLGKERINVSLRNLRKMVDGDAGSATR